MVKDHSSPLTQSAAVRYYDESAASGSDKKYPTTNLVRLEAAFFGHEPGRLLEYAFGTGCNLIHLLECGHEIEAIDTSPHAERRVEDKLAKRSDIAHRATLRVLEDGAPKLPYPDDEFDYVNCMSVLSLLGHPSRIEALLVEFHRVMKPGAKIIADINGPESVFAIRSKPLGDRIFEFSGPKGDKTPFPCYCPATPEEFSHLIAQRFIVDDVGFAAHSFFDYVEQEYIVCAHKAASAV